MKKHDDIPQVAIVVSTRLEWGRQIIKGILSYANEVGPWHLWIQPSVEESLDHLPPGWRGDGIIAHVKTQKIAEQIRAAGLPVVNVADFQLEGFSAPRVQTDDIAGTQMAAEHFIERGFKNFAIAAPGYIENAVNYSAAYCKTLQENGFNCTPFSVEKDDPELNAKLTAWVGKLPKPVSLLIWGHGFGRAVVDCCMEAGISVPHDVAILSGSYDDLLSHACFPALSGVIGPTEQIGYKAAGLLHDMMEGKKVPHKTVSIPPLGIKEKLSTETLAVDDPKLIQVVEFLRKHAFEPITMNDVLKAVPMARRSLDRRFQQMFGRSPTDEIRRLRINKARQLLAETDLPMQHIAEACGFATYNYLTHVFKQVTGITPRDYRKKMKKG